MQKTKRYQASARITPQSNERYLREMLANKISGSHMGLWLLIPEYLRLGAWDLLKGVFNQQGGSLHSRLALQMVNESALCVNRIRKKDSLCHQGFSLVNGLSFLATDESIHSILDSNPVLTYQDLQTALLQIRLLEGHYSRGTKILAIDPHRIVSTSRRVMAQKKKRPEYPSEKMLQTFFCNDIITGQPLGFISAATGKNSSQATLQLLNFIQDAGVKEALVLADKEHFTQEIAAYFHKHPTLNMLIPAPMNKVLAQRLPELQYSSLWPGYSIAESEFAFTKSNLIYRLIVQKESVVGQTDKYKPFITTSDIDAKQLITNHFPERWSIEEFFNFEGDMGWNRASTFNLNIRYGRQTLALIAQAAVHRLRKNLPGNYHQWSAQSISQKVLTNMEGDVKVQDDRIIVTYYRDHEFLQLKDKYANISNILENENVSPKIPWLYDYKLEFRFK